MRQGDSFSHRAGCGATRDLADKLGLHFSRLGIKLFEMNPKNFLL
jgi:hypothetical protein